MVLLFFHSDFPVHSYELLNAKIRKLIRSHAILIMHVNSECIGLPVRYTVEQ